MINILYVLVEQGVFSLDKPFYYFYETEKEVKTGTRVLVNFNNREVIGFVIDVQIFNGAIDSLYEKYEKIKSIEKLIDDEPIVDKELFEVAQFMSKRYVCPLISCLQAILPKSLKPSSSSKNAAKPQYFYTLEYKEDGKSLTKKQQELLDYIKENHPLKNEVSPSIAKKLLDLGLIEIVAREKVSNISYNSDFFEPFELTKTQKEIYDGILNTKKTTSLIFGVTGSGKTEIYIKLIAEMLKNGRTAMFLVPEINLTPYFCDKLNYYFKDKVSILTSGLSDSIRYAEYRKILRGKSKIVIGTRSAVFAPLKNIGLIIIDEEFNETYKQTDEHPQYHAIDIAKFRCSQNNAKLVLGSATPSIETMARAKSGQYEYFELKERYNKKELPNAKLINMSNRDNLYPGCSFLSKELVFAAKLAIMKNEKVLFLLNKKGSSGFSICDECNTVLRCEKCNKALTYNKTRKDYRCYTCGKVIKEHEAFCQCGCNSFTNFGVGIQALEAALKSIFPNEKILRLDTDVAKNAKQISNVLNEFKLDENHILIGTEMIAKGHDFQNVTVVGIICIDYMLNFPFYNSNERIFQLITQCIGRAGRAEKEGYAYVQTYTNNSYAINVACAQDYDLFFKKEMENRKISANPPYFYVSTIKFLHTNINFLRNFTYEQLSKMQNILKEDLNVSYVKKNLEKQNNKYAMTIVMKYKNNSKVIQFLNEFSKHFSSKNKIDIKINIDCLNY